MSLTLPSSLFSVRYETMATKPLRDLEKLHEVIKLLGGVGGRDFLYKDDVGIVGVLNNSPVVVTGTEEEVGVPSLV